MCKILFVPLNTNHVLIFQEVITLLSDNYEVLCHDRISEAEQFHTEALLRQKSIRYRHLPESIHRKPDDHIMTKLFVFFKIRKLVRNLLGEISPKVIVLALDNDPLALTVINEAKKRGIPTVLVPEGLLKPYEFSDRKIYLSRHLYNILSKLGIYIEYSNYGDGGCDKILVSGKRAFDILGDIGVPEDKMIIVGQQKYDSFLKNIEATGGKPEKSGVYLYAASTRIFNDDAEIKFLRQIIESTRKLKLHLLVKLHPRTAQKPEELFNLLQIQDSSFVEITKEGYETFEILNRVDAVITISSAIILEALMMDKECVTADYLAGRRRFDYDSYDALHKIENEKEIEKALQNSIFQRKSYENKKRLLEDELYKLDGKASQRTAGVIESMIRD